MAKTPQGFPATVLQAPDIVGEAARLDLAAPRPQPAPPAEIDIPDFENTWERVYMPIVNQQIDELESWVGENIDGLQNKDTQTLLQYERLQRGINQTIDMGNRGLEYYKDSLGNVASGRQEWVDPEYATRGFFETYSNAQPKIVDGEFVFENRETGEPIDPSDLSYMPELRETFNNSEEMTSLVEPVLNSIERGDITTQATATEELTKNITGVLTNDSRNMRFFLDDPAIVQRIFGTSNPSQEAIDREFPNGIPSERALEIGVDEYLKLFPYQRNVSEDEEGGATFSFGSGYGRSNSGYVPSFNRERASDLNLANKYLTRIGVSVPPDEDLDVINFRMTNPEVNKDVSFPLGSFDMYDEYGQEIDGSNIPVQSVDLRPQKLIKTANGEYLVMSRIDYPLPQGQGNQERNVRFKLDTSNKKVFEEQFLGYDENGDLITIERFYDMYAPNSQQQSQQQPSGGSSVNTSRYNQ